MPALVHALQPNEVLILLDDNGNGSVTRQLLDFPGAIVGCNTLHDQRISPTTTGFFDLIIGDDGATLFDNKPIAMADFMGVPPIQFGTSDIWTFVPAEHVTINVRAVSPVPASKEFDMLIWTQQAPTDIP